MISIVLELKPELVVLFYSERSSKISYRELDAIYKSGINVSFKLCQTGNNSLDFQLSSYLGYLAGKNNNINYIIISNDKGFDTVVLFLQSNANVKVKRIGLNNINDNKYIEMTVKSLPNFEKCEAVALYRLINSNKNKNLEQFHNILIKKYGQERGLIIYKAIKPVLKKLINVDV